MTLYEKLFDLKYRQGIPTCELPHRFPEHIDLVSEVALLEIPEDTLRGLALERKILQRLMSWKRAILKNDLAQQKPKKDLA